MSKVWPDIEPKLDTFKVMVEKGHKCRFCETQVDAPGRHVRQCVPLLQAHAVQSTQELGLSREQESTAIKQSFKPTVTLVTHSPVTSTTTQLTCSQSLLRKLGLPVPFVATASAKARRPAERTIH